MLVVTAGIHGNEPSGAAVLPALAADGVVTFGPCNPWGLAKGRRTLEDGRDLNRSFARRNCEEAERVRGFLRAHPPSLLLDLHEDSHVEAPYIIQYGPDDDIASRIVAHLAPEHRFEAHPRFGPVRGEHGVLRPSRMWVSLVGLSMNWPLVYWVHRTFRCTACVIEVPSRWPLEHRVAMHRTIVRAAATVA